jgi:glycerol-3-phosphate acyltransferase PlsX
MDFFTDRADVILCDGFVGNILMKFTEGLGSSLGAYLTRQLTELLSPQESKRVISELWTVTNLPRKMGGPLFGVNGAVILGHGSSRSDGVAGAIDTGVNYVKLGLLESMRKELVKVQRGSKLKVG